METACLVRAALPTAPLLHGLLSRRSKHCVLSRAPTLTPCFYSRVDIGGNNTEGGDSADEQHKDDIWELFSEAQRNILYLNKQRLVAMEELRKVQDENKFLLEKIERLETGRQGFPIQTAESSSLFVLLLRIDTMVVSGMMDTGEASILRKKVVDNRNMIRSAFSDIHHKTDTELLSELHHFKAIEKPLHVVHISTEMDPVASCGSLASYVTGLSRALQRKGNLVEVLLPKYASAKVDGIEGLRKAGVEFDSYFGSHWHKNRVWAGVSGGVGLTLLEPVQLSYFSRDMLRGYSDDFERFSYFSRASLDYLAKSGKWPDILHIHNWETAIVGPLFWDIFAHQGFGNTRILLTCQDLSSQCLEQSSKLELCGLDPHRLHRPDCLQDTNKTHLVNVLKGGIVYSNKVLLMSSTHSKDMLIHGLGHGLEIALTQHKEKVSVAAHGFDGEYWDPSKDMYIPRPYSSDNIEGKSFCRAALQRRVGFKCGSSIVVGCICDGDSNVDNLRAAVRVALRKGAQLIFMENKGSVMNSTIQALKGEIKFIKLADEIKFVEKYDETLAHLIFAGCDIILCSSFHDTSLQTAMKAIKYGSAPVQINLPNDGSRELKMHEHQSSSQNGSSRQSVEHDYGSTAVSQYIISTYGDMGLSQALDDIKNDRLKWDRRIKDGMEKDFSWDAECYDLHWEAYSSIRNV